MKYSTKNIVEDKKSGEYRLSHHLDLKTGMYKVCSRTLVPDLWLQKTFSIKG
jgi:ribosomal protein L32